MTKTLEEITTELEGKYIIFAYRECDDETEDCGIAIWKMKKSKLEKIFNPGTHYDPGFYQACQYNEETRKYISVNDVALKILKKLDVKEVHAVFTLEDFFGIPHHDFCTINPKGGCEEVCFNWGWYRWLHEEPDLADFLVSNGIKVKDYNAD